MKEQKNLNEIIKHRLEKLNKIRTAGYEPYAYRFDKTASISEVLERDTSDYENEFKVAGRIVSFRKMGKASFINIQDETNRIQIYLKDELLPANIYNDIVRNLDLGDIIGCKGILFITKSGELSIKANNIMILSKNIRPLPNLKEKDGETFNAYEDKELRYRHRQLDLIANPDVKKVFRTRSFIISTIRRFLDNKGYLEVETPILQPVYGGASARPFTTFHNTLQQNFYLRIADELYLKRLIIGGFEKVYELSKDFRNEGMDRNHNPEFTMLEFYQAYSDVYDMMALTESLFKYIAKELDLGKIKIGDHDIDLLNTFHKKSMFDLLQEHTGVDMQKMSTNELLQYAKEKSLDVDDRLNYGQLLDKIFGYFVEPKLIEPTFVVDYPKAISPLAKELREGSNDLVERFELFIGGTEYSNSFSELNDPIEQRARLESQNKLREEGDEEAQILDENFIHAMEIGMPPTGGVGIGVDRLVMLFTGQESIKDVILFPALRNDSK